MIPSQYFKRAMPFVILCALFSLLWYELFYSHPHDQPSALLNELVPAFELTDLLHPPQTFTEKNLTGHVSLLNIWATWCYACLVEHNMLMKISTDYHIPIYSIAYKDDPSATLKWLNEKGNPYIMLGNDVQGSVGIDLGIYGTPETFIINSQGKIVYRHIGALDENTWNNVLHPIIKRIST